MATEAEIKKMKRGELNELAAEYGLNPDDYSRADDLRSAVFEYLRAQEQAQQPESHAEQEAEPSTEAEADTQEKTSKPNPPRPRIERRSKRYKGVHERIDKDALYSRDEAAGKVADIASANFDEAVELHVKLGVDTKHADQLVRGTVVLPHGSGTTKTVAAVVPEEKQKEAEASGADIAGHQNVLDAIDRGQIDFDVLVAHPDVMTELSKYAKTLGPQGLMPNPKAGTVTENIADTVGELKSGRIEYRVDQYGNIHQIIGRASFTPEQLSENMATLVASLVQDKPSSIKGTYLQKAYVTTTMGPSIKLDVSTLTK